VGFKVTAEAPPGAGKIVSLEWDFLGTGDFVPHQLDLRPVARVEVQVEHIFPHTGSYVSAVRIASQIEDLISTPFARVHNLARTLITVEI
jgi:hypothetical protein